MVFQQDVLMKLLNRFPLDKMSYATQTDHISVVDDKEKNDEKNN